MIGNNPFNFAHDWEKIRNKFAQVLLNRQAYKNIVSCSHFRSLQRYSFGPSPPPPPKKNELKNNTEKAQFTEGTRRGDNLGGFCFWEVHDGHMTQLP